MAGNYDFTHAMAALPGRSRSPPTGSPLLPLTALTGSANGRQRRAVTGAVPRGFDGGGDAGAARDGYGKHDPRPVLQEACAAGDAHFPPCVDSAHFAQSRRPARGEGCVSAPRRLARHLGLPETGLDRFAEDVSREVQAALAQQGSPAQRMNRLTADLGDPARDAKRDVYLVTISRVLPDALDQTDLVDVEAMSREDVGRALLSALNGNGGGVVKKMAVFKALGRDPARAGEAPTGCDMPRSALDRLRELRAGRVAGRRDLAPPCGALPTGDARGWVVALPCRSFSLPEQALVPRQARRPRACEDGYPLVLQPFAVVERAAILCHPHAEEARRGRQRVALVP